MSYTYNLSHLKRSYSMSFPCPDTPKPSLEKQFCWADPWCKQWSICSPPRRAVMCNMACDCHNAPACGAGFAHLSCHWCKKDVSLDSHSDASASFSIICPVSMKGAFAFYQEKLSYTCGFSICFLAWIDTGKGGVCECLFFFSVQKG